MTDQVQDIKKDVAEIKFLIHDLRVEGFINEIIHFHVTVNTDLEIRDIDQAQIIHGGDLQELKSKAVSQRKTFEKYCNTVQNFSPDETILAAGRKYVETIYDICELILNPRWGRADQVISFLPGESHSARSYPHYMNCIRWICGVHARIRHFMQEQDTKDVYEKFDISDELQDFVRNVVYGYVTEKSSARVGIQLDRMDPAILGGNRFRFHRMFFNLVMNAVDAMSHKGVGVINISSVVEGNRVVLSVKDNGFGMNGDKVEQLLAARKSRDGELHSLGFVFVNQTAAEFGGDVSIESEVGKGTTVSISLPHLDGAEAAPRKPHECEDLNLVRGVDGLRKQGRAAHAKKLAAIEERHSTCGEVVYADYMVSDAPFPGCIFAMGVTDRDKIDFFTHRPYERAWNITHEDLTPMFFEATIRGRLENDEDRVPVLILKAPQNVREYLEFREVPDDDRSVDAFIEMIHDEYIRIGRKLVETGLSPQMRVRLTDLQKFFGKEHELVELEPFELEVLARQELNTERNT